MVLERPHPPASPSLHPPGAPRRLLPPPPVKKREIGAETLLSAVLDAAADGIIVIGADGQILTYNDRFVEIWEVSRQTLLSRDDRQVLAALVKKITDAADFLHHVDTMAAGRDGRALGGCRLIGGPGDRARVPAHNGG